MAYLADGVFVGSRQPHTGVDATSNVPAPQHKNYDVATGQQHHEARKTEMNDIRGKLANIKDNSSDYLQLLNRYHELENEGKAELSKIQTAIEEGPDPTLNAAEKQKYTNDLTNLAEDISKTLITDLDVKTVTKDAGNFFERHAKNALGKMGDSFMDGAQAAWKKASPVLEKTVDKATPLAHAAWDKASPVLENVVDKATPFANAAWEKASPFLEKAWDKSSPVLDAAWDKASPTLYAVRDKAIDGVAATWNHIPGNETVEKKLDNWTDSLPFNNAAKASLHALLGSKNITLDKDATQGIQNDPDFKAKEKTIIGDIKNDPRYGKVAFDIPLSDLPNAEPKTKTFPLELGGKSGDMDKRDQFFHLYDVRNPDIRQTWAVAGNEQSWILRHCQLTGTAHVGADGSITIDYTVKDRLDLSPHGEVDTTYDSVSEKLGAVWHGLLGAEMPWVTGNFTRTVA